MSQVMSEVRSAFSVVADGLRLAGRHLPVLLTLYLFGAGVHGAVIRAAVELSNEHPVLAQLLLPLAPIGTLASFIFMLRVLAPSLRHASFDVAADPRRSPVVGPEGESRRTGWRRRPRRSVAQRASRTRADGSGCWPACSYRFSRSTRPRVFSRPTVARSSMRPRCRSSSTALTTSTAQSRGRTGF